MTFALGISALASPSATLSLQLQVTTEARHALSILRRFSTSISDSEWPTDPLIFVFLTTSFSDFIPAMMAIRT